jgi:hypothetical protein
MGMVDNLIVMAVLSHHSMDWLKGKYSGNPHIEW